MSALALLFQTVALTGGTIHTLEPGDAPFVGTVVVENGYVAAVGPDVAVPEGAERFDATGKHVLPGLIDAFVNHDPDHDVLYLSAGVTCVRDTGNDHTRILVEAQPASRERSPGPWIWCAGAVLEGSPPSTRAVVLLNTKEEVEAKLPRVLEDAIDYLSIRPSLPRAAFERTLEIAHAARKQVWGPLAGGVTLADALEKGQDGVFHLEAFLPSGARFETLTDEQIEAVARLAGGKHLRVTPTLAVYGHRLMAPKTDSPDFRYLSPLYEALWKQEGTARDRFASVDFLAAGDVIRKRQWKLVKSLFDHGARIVPGSGAPNAWLFPGRALLDELSLLRGAGLSTDTIVRLATQGAAEALGMEKRGTIRKGKVGDLVVTAQDPLADLAHLFAPAAVVVRGRLLDRAALDAKLARMAELQAKVRETLAKPLEVAEPEIPSGDVVLSGSVETRGLATRVSAERFAVVRRYDGSLAYCGRVVIPGLATNYSTETCIQQTIQDGELVEFDVKITSGNVVDTVHGAPVAGKFVLERRRNGQFVSNDPVSGRFALVDCGSVTSLLVLGYHRSPGRFKVFEFDDYEPAVFEWELRLDAGAVHLVRTPRGDLRVAYDESGGIREAKREVASTIQQTLPLGTKAHDGKGLPMPATKRGAAPK